MSSDKGRLNMTGPNIYVEVTGGDQMSDRLRSALDRLSQTLADADLLPDVEGFTTHGGTRIDIGGTRPTTGGSKYATRPTNHGMCFGNWALTGSDARNGEWEVVCWVFWD